MPKIFLSAIAALVSLCAVAAANSPQAEHEPVSIEVFGGRLPIPPGYRLLPELGDELRLVRIDRDPRKPHGNIYVGLVTKMSSKASREASARELGATLERSVKGNVQIEITRRTTRQLLATETVTYVSALLYDGTHYVRITDSDPDLWKSMLDQCTECGTR